MGKGECFVMQMLYVCVLCASCGSSQCCVLHDLKFVNAGRGCKRGPYGRGILQSWSHNCLVVSHEGLGKKALLQCVCNYFFLLSCHYTLFIHWKTHSFAVSLNSIKSSVVHS